VLDCLAVRLSGLRRSTLLSAAAILLGTGSGLNQPSERVAAPPERPTCIDQLTLEDHFAGDRLDPCVWVMLRENWGGKSHANDDDYNGGVVPENVSVNSGALHLRALGNLYGGQIRGIGSDGKLRSHGQRAGGVISSRQRFLGGTFEARAKIVRRQGVCSAMWTFFLDGQQDKPVRNHEIDIEFPAHASPDAPPSFEHVAFTTWTGLDVGESSSSVHPLNADPGDFLVLRFDWQPPTPSTTGAVRFYVNGTLRHETREHVPSEPAPFLIGVWFPRGWAGEPNFAADEMLVDWVRISPLR
jgi:beta-glucanase (GH16 family)